MGSKEKLKKHIESLLEKKNPEALIENLFNKIELGIIYQDLTREDVLSLTEEFENSLEEISDEEMLNTVPEEDLIAPENPFEPILEDFEYMSKVFKRVMPRYLTSEERREFMRRINDSNELSPIAKFSSQNAMNEIRVIGEDENGNICLGNVNNMRPTFVINLGRNN